MPCNCGRKSNNLVAILRAAGANRNQLISRDMGDKEAVMWQVQPNTVTIYVSKAGREYKVRNQFEMVTIDKADRPEFEALGYISPKEQ